MLSESFNRFTIAYFLYKNNVPPGKKTAKNPKRAKCNLLSFDERGKLVKIKENGEVKEDEAPIIQYAQNYNFRQ